MPTSRRRLANPLGWALWLLAGAVGASEPTVLADDLRDPTALAVLAGPTGGYRVLVAEVGAERFVELTVLGEGVLSRREVAPLTGPRPVGLACYGERLLVFDNRGLSLLPLSRGGRGAREPEGPVSVGPPARSDAWLFAPGSDGLLRGRLAAKRVGKPEAFPTQGGDPLAVAMAPDGYAVLLLGGEDRPEKQLAFYDPAEPERVIATYPVDGLTRPIALSYAGVGGATLLALEAGGESPGLYRVVTTLAGSARAELLTGVAEPVALAIAPEGAPLVATRGGELLRFDNLTPEESED